MTIGKLAVLAVATAFASGGIGAALADWRSAGAGDSVVLANDGRRDDGVPELAANDDDDRGDGDRTRGDDGTSGGNNTGDGDRTRGNDGTSGGNNTGDGDWTGGNDGTRGGDNTRVGGGAGGGGGDGGGGDWSVDAGSGGGSSE